MKHFPLRGAGGDVRGENQTPILEMPVYARNLHGFS